MRDQNGSPRPRPGGSGRKLAEPARARAPLLAWLLAGAVGASVGCATWGSPPRAADPPPTCTEMSVECEAQAAALPDETPLVYWLDGMGAICDELDDLRGDWE